MSNPNDKSSDELISAYLDGEVTSQERAQVEQRLRNDPQWQQSLEDLRTLRETLRALPRQKLDDDFRQRVLRIVQEQPAAEAPLTAPPSVAPPPPKDPSPSARRIWRRFMWAASAAAAVALVIVSIGQLPRDAARSVALNAPSSWEAAPIDGEIAGRSLGTVPREESVQVENNHWAEPKVAFSDQDAAPDLARQRGKASGELAGGDRGCSHPRAAIGSIETGYGRFVSWSRVLLLGERYQRTGTAGHRSRPASAT